MLEDRLLQQESQTACAVAGLASRTAQAISMITSRAQMQASRTPASRRQRGFHSRVLEPLCLAFPRLQTGSRSHFAAGIARLLPPPWRDLPAASSRSANVVLRFFPMLAGELRNAKSLTPTGPSRKRSKQS